MIDNNSDEWAFLKTFIETVTHCTLKDAEGHLNHENGPILDTPFAQLQVLRPEEHADWSTPESTKKSYDRWSELRDHEVSIYEALAAKEKLLANDSFAMKAPKRVLDAEVEKCEKLFTAYTKACDETIRYMGGDFEIVFTGDGNMTIGHKQLTERKENNE